MMLLRMAVRNVLATPVRTLIIGLLVVFGTTLVVVGGALLSTLDRSMAQSVVGSVSGHLQVWSDQARDKVDLFNAPTGTPDLGRIENFHALKDELQTVPGVQAVIPMGTDFATVFSGNLLDVKIGELRQALDKGDAAREAVVSEHLRSMIGLLKNAGQNLKGFARVSQLADDAIVRPEDVDRALSTEFWATLDEHRDEGLDFLENRIAPLAMDESMLFLRYIGTDPQAFAKSFDTFEIVDGQMIPPGQRGFLFAKQMYERQVKHPVARRFDHLCDRAERGETISTTPEAKTEAEQLARLGKEIVLQLDGPARAEVTTALQALLKRHDADISALVAEFLKVDDATLVPRRDFFYETIAPHLVLYKVRVGDTLTIRSVTRSGYMTAVNVKVYGTYRFKGLEKSMLAGVYNLMDLMTFRDLYGYMTEDRRRELAEMQKASGARQIDRAKAEDELFGGGVGAPLAAPPADAPAAAEEIGEKKGFDEFAGVDMKDGGRRYDQDLLNRVYSPDEIETGVVTQVALRLDSIDRIPEAKATIEALSKEKNLGLRVADWREVSGLVGKFIGVIWIVLVTAIVIIFLVALVIINNSMVMATLDRTREIGAMRAMGAQKRTILGLLVLESVVLGFGFGLVGVALGSTIILVLGHVGIPAFTDELYFLFAGPRLLPSLAPEHFLVAFAVVFVVTVASVFYPARLAMAVQPVEAMGKED